MDENNKDLLDAEAAAEADASVSDGHAEQAAGDGADMAEAHPLGEEKPDKGGIHWLVSDRKRLVLSGVLLVLIFLALGLGIAFGYSRLAPADATQAQTGEELLEAGQSSGAGNETEDTLFASHETTEDIDEEKQTTSQADESSESLEEAEEDKQSEQSSDETDEEMTSQEQESSEEDEETGSAAETEDAAEATEGSREHAGSGENQSGAGGTSQTQEAPETAPPTAPAPSTTAQPQREPVSAEGGTPYANHGKLTVSGTNILDQNGNIYQLRGVSTHGIAWFPDYVNKAAFQTMRDEWGVNVVRLAMYSAENNGYCTGGDQTWLKNLIDTGVQAATELGLYVIIDWHVLGEGNPNTYKSTAIEFFREISAKYAAYGNVLYEICNEPNGGVSWGEVKSYAEEVIPVIRSNAPESIVIVGSPTWSQDVHQAAANPVTGYSNIMYSLHFYAATHKDDLRNRMISAVNSGLPIFVTEYGICDASGNGGIDEASANAWITAMNQCNVSFCIWNLSNKNETSALINTSCTKTSGWTVNDLSASGKWFVNMMKGNLRDLGSTAEGEQSAQQPTQTPQTQPATEYVPPTTQAPQQASGANCTVQANNTNSWGDAAQGYHMQLDVHIQNTGDAAITGWKVVLTFSGNVEIESSWNGTVHVNGAAVTITSDADWNAGIQPRSSVSPGLIVKSSTEVQLTGCSVQ